MTTTGVLLRNADTKEMAGRKRINERVIVAFLEGNKRATNASSTPLFLTPSDTR